MKVRNKYATADQNVCPSLAIIVSKIIQPEIRFFTMRLSLTYGENEIV